MTAKTAGEDVAGFAGWYVETGGTVAEYRAEVAARRRLVDRPEISPVPDSDAPAGTSKGATDPNAAQANVAPLTPNHAPSGMSESQGRRRRFSIVGGIPATCAGCGARVFLSTAEIPTFSATRPFVWCDPIGEVATDGFAHECVPDGVVRMSPMPWRVP